MYMFWDMGIVMLAYIIGIYVGYYIIPSKDKSQ